MDTVAQEWPSDIARECGFELVPGNSTSANFTIRIIEPCGHTGEVLSYPKTDPLPRTFYALLAARRRTDWIPVSERLPEVKKVSYDTFSESGFYLVLTSDRRQNVAQLTVPTARPSHWSDHWGNCIVGVIAWQPLPTPPEVQK